MERLQAIVDGVLFYLLSAGLAALVAICFGQVVARYMFNASFSWAEEISIVVLLWVTWWGACMGIKQGSHLRVKLLEEKIARSNVLILRLSLYSLAILLLVVITISSKSLIEASAFITLFSLPNVSRNVMNYSVPVGCILMIYYIARSMVCDWKYLRASRKQGE